MIYVFPKFGRNSYDGVEIDTTSGRGAYRDLSPFILGPIQTYESNIQARNLENCWQFSKVYRRFLDKDGNPSAEYFSWRNTGWIDERAHRYPMGRGAKPEYSWWWGEKLDYIRARKVIYARLYAKYVVRTQSWLRLKEIYDSGQDIILRDYDGYDNIVLGMSLRDVINDPKRKMGHAFVLKMILLTKLEECLQS